MGEQGTVSGPVDDRMTDVVAAVREQVLRRAPVDARERTAIEQFVQQLDRLERPFEEHAAPVHVTGSAFVIGDRGVVLHKHKRLGLWLQPGGHIDPGETPWDAARREAFEETGLPVEFAGGGPQLVHVDVHPGPRKHTHLDLRYLLTAPSVPPQPPEGESQDVQWFQGHRAIAIAEPGLEGALRALQPGEPTLRAARVNDAGDLAHVYVRSREFGLPEVPSIHSEKQIKAWFADDVIGHSEVTVAEVDGTVVGLLVLEHGPNGTGWIEQLYVDPARIGRGLGRRLLERAQHRFPAGLQLWTFQANERARRFYAQAGFAEVETTDGRGNEERAPDVRCTWTP
jgi:8-oxo-dGTP pyrophosphatase MutT (NUDIX family)/ribosomal protein S18 acetylase RimI-like enzyme